MRRPAVLAFTLFAIAASLPAEVRECLPMTVACGHRAEKAGAGASCSRATGAGRAGACNRQRAVECPKTRPTRDATNCRLHPTPPIVRQPPTSLPLAPPAPALLSPLLPIVLTDSPEASRRGWREPPPLRPRASPASAPRSPRPPPFTV
jgi:hypothetical protein